MQKLDQFADTTLFAMNDHTGRVAVMASEEHADILPIPEKYPAGKYVLLFDPLDGSSNIDYNICLGTIFCILPKITEGRGSLADCLQKGRQVVAAGYLLYGTSTMLVYSTGRGVNGFTLDPAVGEFLLSHPNIRMPEPPQYYSLNQGNEKYWSQGMRAIPPGCRDRSPDLPSLSARYIGSLVADFHRNLLAGGVFAYPADSATRPNRTGSCACCTRPSRWLFWRNRREERDRTACRIYWILRRRGCTREHRSLLGIEAWWSGRRNLSGKMVNPCRYSIINV